MKIAKVTYTTKAEYSEKNQIHLKRVMDDLQKVNNKEIN